MTFIFRLTVRVRPSSQDATRQWGARAASTACTMSGSPITGWRWKTSGRP